ncbi:helix-turn-helix domain-containing protein [Schleiferilactobacillus harbinensis]|jgi:putative transcriptional regulator|uniref:helix-turn-helix domain-containing protein n=1 Tax=Schleiferilactobacillus harbinensis TaxID=304207 RepID=UPI0007BA68DB|nr:helix-turn-helix domain-containing protein [Schleiferilactobacillus harbinensis]
MDKDTEKTDVEQSVDQIIAYLYGDSSQAKVDMVVLNDPPQYTPTEIKTIRQKTGATQRVLAEMLAVSPRTVEAWEVGRTIPTGSARRLLQLLDKDPQLLQPLG